MSRPYIGTMRTAGQAGTDRPNQYVCLFVCLFVCLIQSGYSR
jgi:hypothetical protein